MLHFVIDSFLLQHADKTLRQSFASLIHFCVFHYECGWKILIYPTVSLGNWHPLVKSPIPYPNIEMTDDIDILDTTILLTTRPRSELVQTHPALEIFSIEPISSQVLNLQNEFEERISEKLLQFKKSCAPSQQFYPLCFTGEWEEIFIERIRLNPSANYDCDRFGPFWYYRRLEYAWSLAQLNYSPGLKTLDIGSLTTFVPYYLAEKGLEVISIDIDQKAVEWQNQVAIQLHKPFKVLLQDITKTNFSNNAFDQATIISVIEHLHGDGDIRAMREIHRILKRGGIIAITAPYDHQWAHEDTGIRPSNSMQRYYTMQTTIERLIQPPLFEVIDIEYIGGKMISHTQFENQFSNPTKAAIICLALRKK